MTMAQRIMNRYGIVYVKREYSDEMQFTPAKPLIRMPQPAVQLAD